MTAWRGQLTPEDIERILRIAHGDEAAWQESRRERRRLLRRLSARVRRWTDETYKARLEQRLGKRGLSLAQRSPDPLPNSDPPRHLLWRRQRLNEE